MGQRIGLRLAAIVFLLLCVTANLAWAEAILSSQEFTQSYVERVEKQFPGAKVTVTGDLEVKVKLKPDAEGEGYTSYLDNSFKTYLGEPAQLGEIMDQLVRVLGDDVGENATPRKEQLVAVIRHKGFMDDAKKARRTDQYFPERQLAGDIHVFYAFDAPNTLHFADSKTIKELGLAEADLDALALENLQRIMAEPLIDTYPEMVAISANDPYLASLLLFDRFWAKERFRFRGDLVVFVVARDLMLVTGSEESGGLAAAREAVQQLFGQVPYAISADPIVRRNGAWQSFVQ